MQDVVLPANRFHHASLSARNRRKRKDSSGRERQKNNDNLVKYHKRRLATVAFRCSLSFVAVSSLPRETSLINDSKGYFIVDSKGLLSIYLRATGFSITIVNDRLHMINCVSFLFSDSLLNFNAIIFKISVYLVVYCIQ